jgi:hypothetical protein
MNWATNGFAVLTLKENKYRSPATFSFTCRMGLSASLIGCASSRTGSHSFFISSEARELLLNEFHFRDLIIPHFDVNSHKL